jgi:2-polyprenyl-3-methyl-5-hydroxy-6-metoxy-1,4-benzoquinol methylase
MNNNNNNIIELLDKLNLYSKRLSILDLGIGDGKFTSRFSKKFHYCNTIYGIEIDRKFQFLKKLQNNKRLKIFNLDLNKTKSLPKKKFDIIMANQIIEHCAEQDLFFECLDHFSHKNTHIFISTENSSSLLNILPLFFGYQMFALTSFSKKGILGNPLSLYKSSKTKYGHRFIHSPKSFEDIANAYNYKIQQKRGSGFIIFLNFILKYFLIYSVYMTFHIKKEKI